MRKTSNLSTKKLLLFGFVFFTCIMLALFSSLRINASSNGASIKVKEVNYQNSTITLQANSGDTKIYFSDSTQKKWLEVPGVLNSDKTIVMDFSWVAVSSNYEITFKGDSSTKVSSVTIPKQVTNFKATFNKVKGAMVFSNVSDRTIQWRKKGSTTWLTVDEDTLALELSYLYTNGATIYFRLAPENGSGSADAGLRASKEVSVSIPKKTAAPSIIINGSNFSIPVESGMAYRYLKEDGTTSDWTSITATRDLALSEVAAKALYSGSGKQEEVSLQFRKNASSTTQVSNITTVTIPVQEGAPSENECGISLTYTSSSTLALQVKAASSTTPFEYAIVEEDDVLDYSLTNWISITSNKEISINNNTAKEGSKIYVRKKSTDASGAVSFSLASAPLNLTGENGVCYPDPATADGLTTIITTAGVCNTSDTGKTYTFTLYSPTRTTVSSIEFKDVYGNNAGSVGIKSTVAANSDTSDSAKKYIITTKINSTEKIDANTEEALYATITLASGEVFESTKSSGVMMYLYPATVLNNPEKDDDYATEFVRLMQSNEKGDKKSFKFQLDFGKGYLYSSSEINKFTAEKVTISSIEYDGYTLTNGDDYKAEYGSYINDEGDTVMKATVTVNVDQFESEADITVRDEKEAFVIKLSNGEVLNKSVAMSLIRTATINEAPIAWSVIAGSLDETKTSSTTDSNGDTTTVTNEVITYKLTLSVFNNSYNIGVSDVTWGGTSILRSAKVSGGVITIELSNAKINKLTTTSSTTNNLVITLSNGYSITSGCKLTILDSGK